jgi:anti-sigma factor RsiW
MRCLKDKQLQAYIDGEATSSDSAEIDRHLNVCPPCHERLSQLRTASERVKTRIAQLDPAHIPAPPLLRSEKSQRSAHISPFWSRLVASYIRVPAAALAMAGVFIIGVALGAILKGSPRAREERWPGRRAEAAQVTLTGTASVQVLSVGLDLKDYSPLANPRVFTLKE